MGSVTTFGAFTTARLGIYAAQKGLDVTGQNISNINTTGYTREVVNQASLRTGGHDYYTSSYSAGVGSGVVVTGISQLRDPYLDIRYRNEQSSVGAMDTKQAGLEELSGILDEVADNDGNGVMEAQFNDLVSQLQTMSDDHSTEEEYDSLVRSSADSLVKLFNSYADRLQTVKENQEDSLDQDVSDVNDILTNIQQLNSSIQKSQVHGDNALEMQDQRNLLIDQLSYYMKIDVTYQSVSIGAGSTVDKLVINTAGDPERTLVDGDYATQLSVSDDSNYNITLAAPTNANGVVLKDKDGNDCTDVTLGDTELYGSIQASRELLTESGEYSSSDEITDDSEAATKRGIPYYQNVLDSLANKFAEVLNGANMGYLTDSSGNYIYKTNSSGQYVDSSGNPVESPAGTTLTSGMSLTDDQKADLDSAGVKFPLGGALFSNSSTGDDTTGITAANISISQSWASGDIRIQNSFVQDSSSDEYPTVGSSDNSNIIHIIALMDDNQDYTPGEVVSDAATADDTFFSGSFQQMLTNIQATLAQDSKSTSTLLDNYSSSATELDSNRDSVSGVDLNDEAMSLMQYQKSYSAACRLMTTLDEALDKLINDTGTVGR